MKRCILMYFIHGRNQQEDIWFESFAEAYAHCKRENWAWSSWAIHHVGNGIQMAYSRNS